MIPVKVARYLPFYSDDVRISDVTNGGIDVRYVIDNIDGKPDAKTLISITFFNQLECKRSMIELELTPQGVRDLLGDILGRTENRQNDSLRTN